MACIRCRPLFLFLLNLFDRSVQSHNRLFWHRSFVALDRTKSIPKPVAHKVVFFESFRRFNVGCSLSSFRCLRRGFS